MIHCSNSEASFPKVLCYIYLQLAIYIKYLYYGCFVPTDISVYYFTPPAKKRKMKPQGFLNFPVRIYFDRANVGCLGHCTLIAALTCQDDLYIIRRKRQSSPLKGLIPFVLRQSLLLTKLPALRKLDVSLSCRTKYFVNILPHCKA